MSARPGSPSSFALACALAAAFGAAASGQNAPPPIDAELRARFGFVGPKVHKVGDGLGFLRVVDLDRDGRHEVLVNHAQRGRLAILTRDADGDVESSYVDTDGAIRGLAVADVDRDGTEDLLLLSQRGRLVTKLRGASAAYRPPLEVGLAGTVDALRAGDVDGDGVPDAVVVTDEGIRVVTGLAGEARVSAAVSLGTDQVLYFRLVDLDDDGALDVLVATNADRAPLRWKRGDGKGGFGPWVLFDVPELRYAFPGVGRSGRSTLTVVQNDRGRVVDYALRREAQGAAPQLVGLPAIKRGAFPFAHGDVDGDGDDDFVVAHPERAELHLFEEQDGRFAHRIVPTLAGVTCVALGDVDRDGKLDIVFASPEEQAVAVRYGGQPWSQFPQRLPTTSSPVAVAVPAGGGVLFVAKDKRRQAKLFRVAPAAAGERAFEPAAEAASFGRLAADPQRLLLAELDPTPGADLAFVVPGDGLRLLRSAADGAFAADGAGAAAAGFPKKLDDGAVDLVTDGDRPALLVVRDRFARAVRFDAGGQPEVVRQLNAPAGANALQLGTVFADGTRVFVDRGVGKLFVERADRAPQSIDLPAFGATHVVEHAGDAVLVGRSGLLRVPLGGEAWRLEPVRSHEPPTKKTNYWRGGVADLDADGVRDVLLLDTHRHAVHVLVADAPGRDAPSLARALSFPVFELPSNDDAVYEPRAFGFGDWDGDGRTDLVLLAHDRVLIYEQES